MPQPSIFGHIEGFDVGTVFRDRRAVADAGVHRPHIAGICGTKASGGAESIVLNAGYEDDEDHGYLVVYTGHGGNDPATGKQVADQRLAGGNEALALNSVNGRPVRVVRGYKHRLEADAPAGLEPPASGYRYDGLYRVESYWRERGKSGFDVYRFRMVPLDALLVSGEMETAASEAEAGPAPRVRTTVQRIVRDTQVARRVKALHDDRCQACGTRLETPAGPYSEGCHVIPLGRPHDGPDAEGNVLCLCPNCHVLLDSGALGVADDLSLIGTEGCLRTAPGHAVSLGSLRHHRERFAL